MILRASNASRFDLYGSRHGSLDEVRQAVEDCLDCKLFLHESGYLGGEYFRASGPPEEIEVLTHNADEEGYLAEPSFSSWPFLVYINSSTRWSELDELTSRMPTLVHLRSEIIES